MTPEIDNTICSEAWHALHTRHQHEKVVAEILANKGFEIYLPLYAVIHRWKDRNKQVSLPLFPCYVFLRGGLDRRIQVITTAGVHGIVTTAGRPGIIPEPEIDVIRRVIENQMNVEPSPFLNCGDRVRVHSGPLAGVEGILINKQNQPRLVLSVEILGRSVSVEVAISMVDRLSGSRTALIHPSLYSEFSRMPREHLEG